MSYRVCVWEGGGGWIRFLTSDLITSNHPHLPPELDLLMEVLCHCTLCCVPEGYRLVYFLFVEIGTIKSFVSVNKDQ